MTNWHVLGGLFASHNITRMSAVNCNCSYEDSIPHQKDSILTTTLVNTAVCPGNIAHGIPVGTAYSDSFVVRNHNSLPPRIFQKFAFWEAYLPTFSHAPEVYQP